MSNLKKHGSCLCGGVKFDVTLQEDEVHICHCELCQKWHGGVGFGLKCEGDWVVQGEENLTWFDSSEWAQRSFCQKCGTHLLFKTHDGSYHGVSAGALDNATDLKLGMHIFIDKKPDYFDFTGDAPRFTEKEFLQMVGASE